MIFHPDKKLFQVEPLILGLQGKCFTPTPRGTHKKTKKVINQLQSKVARLKNELHGIKKKEQAERSQIIQKASETEKDKMNKKINKIKEELKDPIEDQNEQVHDNEQVSLKTKSDSNDTPNIDKQQQTIGGDKTGPAQKKDHKTRKTDRVDKIINTIDSLESINLDDEPQQQFIAKQKMIRGLKNSIKQKIKELKKERKGLKRQIEYIDDLKRTIKHFKFYFRQKLSSVSLYQFKMKRTIRKLNSIKHMLDKKLKAFDPDKIPKKVSRKISHKKKNLQANKKSHHRRRHSRKHHQYGHTPNIQTRS